MSMWKLLVFFLISYAASLSSADQVNDNFSRIVIAQRTQPSAELIPVIVRNHRVALVIGNEAYLSSKPLTNPVRDAELIAAALKNLNFDVTVLRNTSRVELLEGLDDFEHKATGADAVVFYFSGHGIQDVQKKNYLMPIDASISGEASVRAYGLEADLVSEAIARAAPRVGLIVLDACRDNPFSIRRKSYEKGLARMNVRPIGDSEILIHFATRDGDTAEDGFDNNSPYARALARQLPLANQYSVRQILDNVGEDVRRTTADAQRPVQFGEMRVSSYLVSPDTSTIRFSDGNTPMAIIGPDEIRWRQIVNSKQRSDFETFLSQHPRSRYAALAQSRIAQIDEQISFQLAQRDQQGWFQADSEGTEMGYLQYLRAFPSGAYVNQSNDRLKRLREKEQIAQEANRAAAAYRADSDAWQIADVRGTEEDYRQYIKDYPSGRFLSSAQARIRTLVEESRIRKLQDAQNSAASSNESQEGKPNWAQRFLSLLPFQNSQSNSPNTYSPQNQISNPDPRGWRSSSPNTIAPQNPTGFFPYGSNVACPQVSVGNGMARCQ